MANKIINKVASFKI